MNPNRELSEAKAAQTLGVSPQTLGDWRRKKWITPTTRWPSGRVTYSIEYLERFKDNCTPRRKRA